MNGGVKDMGLLAEVTSLFVQEADLLDDWQLDAWLGLLTEDVCYKVHPLDYPAEVPPTAMFLVFDDRARLDSRVAQLNGRTSWAEQPRSRTRRIVSNVRAERVGADEVRARANFAVWRFKNGQTDVYVGRYEHRLVMRDGRLRMRERTVRLDLEALRPHGKLSFIL